MPVILNNSGYLNPANNFRVYSYSEIRTGHSESKSSEEITNTNYGISVITPNDLIIILNFIDIDSSNHNQWKWENVNNDNTKDSFKNQIKYSINGNENEEEYLGSYCIRFYTSDSHTNMAIMSVYKHSSDIIDTFTISNSVTLTKTANSSSTKKVYPYWALLGFRNSLPYNLTVKYSDENIEKDDTAGITNNWDIKENDIILLANVASKSYLTNSSFDKTWDTFIDAKIQGTYYYSPNDYNNSNINGLGAFIALGAFEHSKTNLYFAPLFGSTSTSSGSYVLFSME